jgi:hypothetical protein
MLRCKIFIVAVLIMSALLLLVPVHGQSHNDDSVGSGIRAQAASLIELVDEGWSGEVAISDCLQGWGDTQWKLTLAKPSGVTISAKGLHCPGDYFKIYSGPSLIGTTPNLAPPWGCAYSGQLSEGSFTRYLRAGTYLIKVRNAGFDGHMPAEIKNQNMCPSSVHVTIGLQRIRAQEISFNWGAGSSAIGLKTRAEEKDVTLSSPEYVNDAKNEPAAYVRNSAMTVQAKFEAVNPVNEVIVWAEGSLGGLSKRIVDFGGTTSSPTVSFTALKNLPDKIGVNRIRWRWKYKTSTGVTKDMGETSHVIYTTLKEPLSVPVYKELIAWTSDWAAGKDNEKQIADAMIRKLWRSGLTYGVGAWTTGEMLDKGGGMCGGWSRMFADMAAAHGISVSQRCFILQGDAAPPEGKWVDIVIKAPGLNLSEPTVDPSDWKDVDNKLAYPYPLYLGDSSKKDDVTCVTEKRWAFSSPYDGHCIDFLEYDGKVYLYDPSFGTGPFNNTFTSVPTGSMTGTALSGFRKNYHDRAIDYMHGVILYRECATCAPTGNPNVRLDVKTRNIPDLRDPTDPETFEIHYIWD